MSASVTIAEAGAVASPAFDTQTIARVAAILRAIADRRLSTDPEPAAP